MPIHEETLVARLRRVRIAGAVGDFNPVHIDDEFPRSTGLPSVIAHGPLTFPLALDRIVSQKGAGMIRPIHARLKAPVFPKDVLSVMPTGGDIEIRNQDGKTVATAQIVLSEE